MQVEVVARWSGSKRGKVIGVVWAHGVGNMSAGPLSGYILWALSHGATDCGVWQLQDRDSAAVIGIDGLCPD